MTLRGILLVAVGSLLFPAALHAEETLEDGVYKVVRGGTRRVQVSPVKDGERVLIYDYRYFEPAGGRPDQLIAVLTTPDVSLELAERPRVEQAEGGGRVVRLKLAGELPGALREFTAGLRGARFVVVVDDEALVVEKVREPIEDGVITISGCSEVGCGYLIDQLADNVRGYRPPEAEAAPPSE